MSLLFTFYQGTHMTEVLHFEMFHYVLECCTFFVFIWTQILLTITSDYMYETCCTIDVPVWCTFLLLLLVKAGGDGVGQASKRGRALRNPSCRRNPINNGWDV